MTIQTGKLSHLKSPIRAEVSWTRWRVKNVVCSWTWPFLKHQNVIKMVRVITIKRDVPFSTIRQKTDAGNLEHIEVKCASLSWKRSNVHKEMLARLHTTVWKSSITLINIRQSFAQVIPTKPLSVNMATFVPLPILSWRFLSISLINLNAMTIFTCSISRQFGVRIMKNPTNETYVFLPTTGRITGANLNSTNTSSKYVNNGIKRQPLATT